MSKAIQCDNPRCKRQEPLDKIDGWLRVKVSINRYTVVGRTYSEWGHFVESKKFHFCSRSCVGQALSFRAEDMIPEESDSDGSR